MLENKEMGFALGAADYLTKPIDAQKLLPVLDATARPSRAEPCWSWRTIRRPANSSSGCWEKAGIHAPGGPSMAREALDVLQSRRDSRT